MRRLNAGLKEEKQGHEIKWKHNGLRHSFISYRVAEINDVQRVALEAGNSPQIIFSNYRALVGPADAKKWFSIIPKRAESNVPKQMENIIPLQTLAPPALGQRILSNSTLENLGLRPLNGLSDVDDDRSALTGTTNEAGQ